MRTFITFSFLLLFSIYSFSQECGAEVDISHDASVLKFNKDTWTDGDEDFDVKVYAHIIVNSTGQGVFTPDEVAEAIQLLNETFGPDNGNEVNFGNNVGIQFYLDACFDYIEMDGYDADISINEKEDGLDIYFFSSQGGPTWGGRASFSSSRLAVIGRFLENGADPIAFTNILAHEVGHVFGLYHTFYNTAAWLCAVQRNGHPSCGVPDLDLIYPEPVDIFAQFPPDLDIKSKTGDYIKDTPADPFNVFSSVLPAEYACVPSGFGPAEDYVACGKNTDCVDHNGTVYKYDALTYENTMYRHNIMSYSYVKCMTLFSADQKTYMRHNLRGATPHLLLLHQSAQDYSIVEDYKKIDCSHTIDYDITIKSGGTLELTKTLFFTPGHGITVESGGNLFLNGGTLTKALCVDDLWDGVGANSGSKVIIQDGKIEYALTGLIYTHIQLFAPFSITPFEFDGAEFAHCNTGIETRAVFISLYLSPNSVMNELNIHDCKIGINAFRTEQLSIVNSTFENNQDVGLKLSDGSMSIRSSGFVNMPIAISYNNMGGSVNASLIGGAVEHNNVFYDNGQGIVANAPFSNNKFLVTHNTFLNNWIGLNIAGLSSSNVFNNDFYGGLGGCGFSDGGGLENSVKDNLFTSNIIGAGSADDNLGLLYTLNCFSANSQGDIALSGFINEEQGNLNLGASNTFSKITNVNTFKLEQAQDFDYFVLDGIPVSDERYPSGIDDKIEDSNDDVDPNCGSTINPFPVINFFRCQCSESDEANEERIEELEQAIDDLKSGNLAANPIFKRILIAKYTSCIEILEECIGKSKEYDEFEIAPDGKDRKDEYDTRSYPLAKVKTMSLMLSRGQWSEARSYLTNHSGEFDVFFSSEYEQLMNIYLDHIDDRSNASTHRQSLESMADEENIFKGYARAMLCYYYDDCRYDMYDFDGSIPRSGKVSNEEFFSVYPNPATSQITITVKEKVDLSIWSINGQLKQKQSYDKGSHFIDISKFVPGVYFCKSFSNLRNRIITKKIVKL